MKEIIARDLEVKNNKILRVNTDYNLPHRIELGSK
jgi:hypothetical protein